MDTCTRLLTGREVDRRRGTGKTKRISDRKAGLLPEPVVRGDLDRRYPEDEVNLVVAAEIRGASSDERRELVKEIMKARALPMEERAAVLISLASRGSLRRVVKGAA